MHNEIEDEMGQTCSARVGDPEEKREAYGPWRPLASLAVYTTRSGKILQCLNALATPREGLCSVEFR